MSLDRDASDRKLARRSTMPHRSFCEGSSLPGVGVLLALPCPVASGLFEIIEKHPALGRLLVCEPSRNDRLLAVVGSFEYGRITGC
jgi:hypothetical protein